MVMPAETPSWPSRCLEGHVKNNDTVILGRPKRDTLNFQREAKAAESIRYQWSAYARDPLDNLTASFPELLTWVLICRVSPVEVLIALERANR